MENECEALPGVAYPGVRDNCSTINTKTGYDDMMNRPTLLEPISSRTPSASDLCCCLDISFYTIRGSGVEGRATHRMRVAEHPTMGWGSSPATWWVKDQQCSGLGPATASDEPSSQERLDHSMSGL